MLCNVSVVQVMREREVLEDLFFCISCERNKLYENKCFIYYPDKRLSWECGRKERDGRWFVQPAFLPTITFAFGKPKAIFNWLLCHYYIAFFLIIGLCILVVYWELS